MKLFNTLSKKIEEIKPLTPGHINMYTCGPTVYNFAHIGNLRTYIFEDLLKRSLEYNGYKVSHAMNITDVGHLVGDGDEGEDKLEVGAKREGKSPLDIAKFYTEKFLADLRELNIEIPEEKMILAATGAIPEQIEIIKLLEEKGFTYIGDKAVYFDTSKFPNYGKLSGQKLSDKRTDRKEVVIDPDKKHPADFALWFFLKGKYQNHILKWASPWGEGFPGWHIECSAISRKLLGQPFDIHCGGVDHIGTHHANEIAQSEAAFGLPLANVWMHGEFLVIPNLAESIVCEFCGNKYNPTRVISVEIGKKDNYSPCSNCHNVNIIKMAKSGNNFITLDTLKEKGFSPLDYRYLCLQAHYRTQLNFTWEALESAHKTLERLYSFIQGNTEADVVDLNYDKQFAELISADINIPQALALAWKLIDDKNVDPSVKNATLFKFDTVFALNLKKGSGPGVLIIPQEVGDLLKQREESRQNKDFAKSDELRKQIESLGYEVMDTSEGQKLKKKIVI